MGRLRFSVAFAVRGKEVEGDHPHPSLPPSQGEGTRR